MILTKYPELGLQNSPIQSTAARNNPISVKILGADINDPSSDYHGSNSNVVKVRHPNHGMVPGDYVMIDGCDDSIEGDGLHEVIGCTLDQFTIKLASVPAKSGNYGGKRVYISVNRPYETINLYSGVMSFESTSVIATNRSAFYAGLPTMDTRPDDPFNTVMKGFNQDLAYTMDTVVGDSAIIPIMDTYYYPSSRLVANNINEALYSDDEHLRQNRTLDTRFLMTTSSDKVSPVIDLDRTRMNVIKNLIDNPSAEFTTTEEPRGIIYWDGGVVPTNIDEFIFTDSQNIQRKLNVDHVDRNRNKITLRGNNVIRLRDATTFNSLPVDSNNIYVYVTKNDFYRRETSNKGSTFSKYITKMFSFESQCDGLEVNLSAAMYNIDDIKVYYKLRTVGFDGEFTDQNWQPFNPNKIKPNETDFSYDSAVGWTKDENTFAYRREGQQLKTTPGLADNIELVKTRDLLDVDPSRILPDDWQTLTYSVQDLQKFDACAIKVVMCANNPAQCPIIDDFTLVVTE